MRYEIFVIISIVMNVFIAGMFPEYVGLDDPGGQTAIVQQKFQALDTNTKEYYIEQGIFNKDGTPAEQYDKLKELAQITETNQGITLTDFGFTFADWLEVGWNYIKSILVFFIASVLIMYNLAAPLNLYIGVPYTLMYIFSWVKFLMGR